MAGLFKKINKISMSTKLRFFQFRVLSKSLITNVRVAKWDPLVSENCTFCHQYKETVVHLLFECNFARKIWTALTKWFKYFHAINIVFTAQICILNDFNKRNSALINNTILITKFYLYKCKTRKSLPVFQHLIKEISFIKNIEYTIAVKNDKLYRFARRWDDFDVFSS